MQSSLREISPSELTVTPQSHGVSIKSRYEKPSYQLVRVIQETAQTVQGGIPLGVESKPHG